jgi:hypothetical protein
LCACNIYNNTLCYGVTDFEKGFGNINSDKKNRFNVFKK